MAKYETIIGLEIHLELNTKSKLYCHCFNKGGASKPNSNICPICLGHPGVLPVLNQQAVKKTLITGLALNGRPLEFCWFDRKNYFYPDLPKGYQISQYQLPLIKGGYLEFEHSSIERKVHLERIHLEEDTAKLLHQQGSTSSLDFNRAGVPLLEIVTMPEITSPGQAKIFVEELQKIVRYLEISDADMEKGQLRCDANISLRPKGDRKYYPKTEIKNLNSFKAVERALSYEFSRQEKLWNKNQKPKYQTTRGWDEIEKKTVEQRGKEEEQDYRYFPEPDLPTLSFRLAKQKEIRQTLPELPIAKRKRFIKIYGFNYSEAKILTDDKFLADYTEKVISELRAWLVSLESVQGSETEVWEKNKDRLIKLVANWLINRLLKLWRENNRQEFFITPENFAEFVILVYEKKVSSTLAQNILEKMFKHGKDVDHVISEYQLTSMQDTDKLGKIIKQVIKDNPGVVEKFIKGNQNVLQFLIGSVMKKTRGQSDPGIVRKLLEKELR